MNEPTTSSVESAPAVAVQRVVRERHPWQQMWDNKAKLKAARKEAKRRYERESPVRNDELRQLKERQSARKKLGLPLDAPLMKPWDHAKGKCPNDQAHRPDHEHNH